MTNTEMNLIHVLECQEFNDGEADGREEAEIVLDEKSEGNIEFWLSYYNIDEDGDRHAVDIRIPDFTKSSIERIVRLTSEWLDDDIKPSVSFSLGEFEAKAGSRGDLRQVKDIRLSINERGVWIIGRERDIEVRVPAGTKRVDGEYENLYNINKFKQLLERFLYGFGKEEVDDYEGLDIAVDDLDNELQERCIPKFNRGEYADAAKTAGQVLDQRISEIADNNVDSDYGANMMKEAFNPETGPLAMGEDNSEKEGIMFLYSGAIQALRNPLSHRTPDPQRDRYLDNMGKKEAHHLICYVDFLLSIVQNHSN